MLEIGSDSDTHTKLNQHDLAEATRVCVGSDCVPLLIPILSSAVEDIDQKEVENAHPESLSAMVSVAIGWAQVDQDRRLDLRRFFFSFGGDFVTRVILVSIYINLISHTRQA